MRAALRLVYFLRWALFVLVVVALGLIGGTAIDRQTPVLAASVQGHTYASVYHPGDLVSGEWTVKAVRPCDGWADRWLSIGTATGHRWVYHLPSVPVRLSDFADDIPGTISYPITAYNLPRDAPAGDAQYFHIDKFICSRPGHWLFPLTVVYQPIDFKVER